VRSQQELDFSYENVGVTRDFDTAGSDHARGDFNVDKNRQLLGYGSAVYRKACDALRNWRQFDLDWVDLCWPDTPICEGCVVALLARVGRGWITNAARIAYVVDESGDQERFGFAYGTLPGHAMRGEERFVIDWNRESNEVHFDVLAISKPNHLISWMSYPLVRRLQSRFRAQATDAMHRAVR
jgi:uncharacterized protein (UPF0548 family)